MRRFVWAIVPLALGCGAVCAAESEPNEKAGKTLLEGRIAAASAALQSDPQDKEALARRAALYAASGQSEPAVADYDRLLKLDPARTDAYDARGSEHFKLGHIAESIADFDRFIKLRPDQEPSHWKRGISYYYAGRWEEGQKQFEGYQTVDDNDVENAVWRYLCMARGESALAARKDILKIKQDLRAGMTEVYNLYAGTARPDDVLAAAKAGSPPPEQLNSRLFYAHLYVGLYYESLGDAARAKQHIDVAVTHKIGHYMWNVADVHAKRLHAAAGQ